MSEELVSREVMYQEQLDPNFGKQIAAMPGGEAINSCIQCGTCSGTCPVSPYMDYAPRRIIGMARAGFKDKVLRSNTIWLCSSCYSCTVECPKNIKVTDVMYALKETALQEGVHPKRFPVAVLAQEFFKQVHKWGRMTESLLITSLYMKKSVLLCSSRFTSLWRDQGFFCVVAVNLPLHPPQEG